MLTDWTIPIERTTARIEILHGGTFRIRTPAGQVIEKEGGEAEAIALARALGLDRRIEPTPVGWDSVVA